MLFDTRVRRSEVVDLSPVDYFEALIGPAHPDGEGEGTDGQFLLARVTYFVNDTDNGGLAQSLGNRERATVSMLVQDFETLQASAQLRALRTAIAALWGDAVPASEEEHYRRIESKTAEWRRMVLVPLSADIEDVRRWYPLFERYVNAHPDEFFLPEEGPA